MPLTSVSKKSKTTQTEKNSKRPKEGRLNVLKMDHVGIAVRDVDKALQFYRDTFKGRLIGYKKLGTTGDYTYTQLGIRKLKIELIEPLGRCNFLERFFEGRGEGLHHLTFEVEDILDAISYFEEKGLRVVDRDMTDPNWRTAFLSPKDTSGVLIQLYSKARKNR